MARYFAWATPAFLMVTGAFLLWQGKAENASLPPAPKPRVATPFSVVPQTLEAPASTAKTREQKRFGRADKEFTWEQPTRVDDLRSALGL